MGRKVEITALVEGGNAPRGPPLSSSLGPLGVPLNKVVDEINKKTAEYKGMKVPIVVKVDPETKQYEVEVYPPFTSALILKEIGKDVGAHTPKTEVIGNISLDKIIKIAKMKLPYMNVNSLKAAVKNVLGTCVSMGVNVDGRSPRDVQRDIDKGVIEVK
ncbi:MAG: 50S ribosomal protein L11 [Candidatus Korarchaeota archaeon]